jgi:altronate dehydratase
MAGDDAIEILQRTMLGHAVHPMVRGALFLEHGCEKIHNDAVRGFMREQGLDPTEFGWASIQLDGGIENVSRRAMEWFAHALREAGDPVEESAGLGQLRLGLATTGPVPAVLAQAMQQIVIGILDSGGTVVVGGNSDLAASANFTALWGPARPASTLACGQRAAEPGLHFMDAPTEHLVEILTGLGAAGADLMMVWSPNAPVQGHPFIPVLWLDGKAADDAGVSDADLRFDAREGDADHWAGRLLELIVRTASRHYLPKAAAMGNTDFQVTRGLLGVST